MARKVVGDIETNGLLHEMSKLWVACFIDVRTGEEFIFSDYSKNPKARPQSELIKFLNDVDVLVGHNFCMFDVPAFKKLMSYQYPGKVIDTLLLSQLYHFTRVTPKGASGPHGLEAWGIRAKRFKPYVDDWTKFDEGKVHRCMEDVHINLWAYKKLQEEGKELKLNRKVLALEHKVAEISAVQASNGWLIDKEFAENCVKELDVKINKIREDIEPRIPPIIKFKDGKATWQEINDVLGGYWNKAKLPLPDVDHKGRIVKPAAMCRNAKFLKSGLYDAHTCKWFGIEQIRAKEDRPIDGPYTRFEFHDVLLSQHGNVKDFLLTQGWVPTEFNFARDDNGNIMRDSMGKAIVTTAKLTDDSLDSIEGEDGKQIVLRNTLVHRRGTIKNEKDDSKGWINQADERGRVSCSPITLGTATGRMGHRGIVNVPGAKSVYGKEMRECFICPEGKILVGCDAASAQLRLLAADMGDPEYIKTVCEGIEEDDDKNYIGTDIHTVNGIAAGLIDINDVLHCRRNPKKHDKIRKRVDDGRAKAKGFIYALLFGAGDTKLAQICGDTSRGGGKRIRDKFMKGLPSLGALVERLRSEFKANKGKNKEGWIAGIDGRRMYVNSEHKLLNYRLQGAEAIYMKTALVLFDEYVKKDGLNSVKILCMMHDEINIECDPEEVDGVVDCFKRSFKDAGVKCELACPMAGGPKIGKNWYEIH